MAGVSQATTWWDTQTGAAIANPLQYPSSGNIGYIPEVWSGKLIER